MTCVGELKDIVFSISSGLSRVEELLDKVLDAYIWNGLIQECVDMENADLDEMDSDRVEMAGDRDMMEVVT